ncbi:hypothetical protein FGADI_7361 [Fusarium gaditjirri]|uniref:Uncharacterized protein n=1 Tax=Fusarium gaditjirri TaxID=282569 RepID=A0A8H4WVQ6_9HYPO|nr:hypothetical protein FGADI_7361 [Fusarium gaditjirri]
MSTNVQTNSITINFKLKAGKKPKKILLEGLEERYGMQNVKCYHSDAKKALAITVEKDCASYDEMKAELWPLLEATKVFKYWEEERIMVQHANNNITYPSGDPYPGQ